ncbi:hypothetical protein [Streptomyces sp. NPDC058683]|uniref:hypothetical protein n=1 Tax=Streptomyces sp. NPDC058683 TaxID=3346597 RepID=UPI003658579E
MIATPHDHSIKCVAASAYGTLVATGSYAGMVAVYSTDSGEWTYVDKPTTAGSSSMRYDAHTGRFPASSYDGSVYAVPV